MHYGKTRVVVCGDAVDLGRTAAAAVGKAMREARSEEHTSASRHESPTRMPSYD